jgi:hypothetical protein
MFDLTKKPARITIEYESGTTVIYEGEDLMKAVSSYVVAMTVAAKMMMQAGEAQATPSTAAASNAPSSLLEAINKAKAKKKPDS